MAATVVRQFGAVSWHVDGAWADVLFPPEGEGGLAAALAAGRVEPVKGGSERRTGRIDLGGRVVYVKEFDGPLAGRRSRREWQTARRVWELGLSTPRPVAATWQGGAVYVSADAGSGQTLSDLVYDRYFAADEDEPPYPGHRPPEWVRLWRRRIVPQATPPVPGPREMARLVADLLVELHSLGLRHRDLHPGNLLITDTNDAGTACRAPTNGNDNGDPSTGLGAGDNVEAGWRMQVLDLVGMAETPGSGALAAGHRSVIDHLVQLNHFFEPLATRSERFRVLKLLERRGLRVASGAAAIEAATRAYRRRFYRGRDKRCLRASKYFDRIVARPLAGFAAGDVAEALPEDAGALTRALAIREPLKSSRREVSGFGLLGERRVFIKRDTRPTWRGTRQRRAWQRANALLVRGLRTARPLVWVDARCGLRGRKGAMASEALAGWRTVDVVLPEEHGARHLTLVAMVAREVRRLHESGMSNRDLKAQNILVRYSGGRWQVAFVDMVGVRRHRRSVGQGRRMQNLMRLAFSWSGAGVSGQAEGLTRADRLRFLKTYLGPQMRRTLTVTARRRGGREMTGLLRRWWRGISFSLWEKAERQAAKR